MLRKSAAARLKQQGEASASTPKVAPMRKNAAKDDHPTKKATGPSVGADKEA